MTFGKKYLDEFLRISKEKFDKFLKTKNFMFDSEIIEQYGCTILYRKKDAYIKITANVHFRDSPAYWNIILGEGLTSFPDTDWNSVALWHLKKTLEPEGKSSEYLLKSPDINALSRNIEEGKNDLEKYGQTFLSNDMSVFYQVRNSLNRTREPYKIYRQDKNHNYSEIIDEESAKLKKKFS